MRDMEPGNINSLICEPVVLKVKFTERLWLQTDFVQPTNPNEETDIVHIEFVKQFMIEI